MAQAKERLDTIRRHLNPNGIQCFNNITWTEANNDQSLKKNMHFKYTLDNSILSTEQRQFYEDNGYLVIKKLIPDELLDRYCERFQDICNGRVHVPFMAMQKDVTLKHLNLPPEHKIYKIQNLFLDEELFGYCCLPALLEYVKCFTGNNIVSIHSMLINKPPDLGSLSTRHPLHQDVAYFPFRPLDSIVCSWTAMDKTTRQNGCLGVIPGTHNGPLLPHSSPNWSGGVNKLYHGIENYSQDLPRVHLEMEEGDTVFFNPVLVHGSGANRTKKYRKAISGHFAASECYYVDYKKTIYKEIGYELADMFLKRGLGTDFLACAKMQLHLVHGKKINL